MASPLIDAPNAVVAALNAETWTESFTAARSYADWDLALETSGLFVDVVTAAGSVETELVDRKGSLDYTVPVHIAIRERFTLAERVEATGRIDVAEIDALVELTDDIHAYFSTDRFSGSYDDIVWNETRLLICPDRRALREWGQFLGIVELRFSVHAAVTS